MVWSLHKKCPCSVFFWSLFSHTRTENGYLQSKSLYSVQIQENINQETPNTEIFKKIVLKPQLILPCTVLQGSSSEKFKSEINSGRSWTREMYEMSTSVL